MLSRLRCLAFWICQQRSTASITSFCCSDFDETLDLPTQYYLGRRRFSPAEISKWYRMATFQPVSLPGICPRPHTVRLVYGRNRQNRTLLSASSSSTNMQTTAKFTSPCQYAVHSAALSSRRRRLDECEPTTPECQQDTSAVARLPAQYRQTHGSWGTSLVVYCRRRRLSTRPRRCH